jgi:uncharacterized membrane protein
MAWVPFGCPSSPAPRYGPRAPGRKGREEKRILGLSGSIGMRWLPTLRSSSLSRPIDRDISRLLSSIRGNGGLWIICLGVCLRLIVYARNHDLCLDEASLWGNIAGKPIHEFSTALSADQLAPLGFLIAERAVVSLLGRSLLVGRLIPFLCGLGALILFLPLAEKILPRRAALVAVALFALSDDLVFYSSELKPYSLDLAVAVALALATLHAIGRPVSGWFGWGMAIGAIASPWFSFPAVFIVSGCGMALILSSLISGRLRDAALWCSVGVAWALSWLAAYKSTLAILSPYTSMYMFWDFAFMPVWPLPMSVERTYQTAGILLEVFVNPLNMVHRDWAGVLLPLLVLLVGTASLARRSWRTWIILVVPVFLAVFASSIRRYPFHGRLILELVPAFYLVIALGAERLRDDTSGLSRLGAKVLLIALLAYPCLAGVCQVALRPGRPHNQHGDLHNNLFLYYDPRLPIPSLELFRTGLSGETKLGSPLEHRDVHARSAVHR